ncbi:WD40-repeat-containing domain protein [Fusarium flagelliforme]|uniref:Mitochondrial division protein 1 n=1 Tax=Fusarium flagelliforme TaxID=2675880 RepID=A0A395MPE6_9HYPO|nr:WD40-repeat-containing domain protein [Fusarium flagelliforme]KAH7185231.1 WD40-repeat-containing domain protein [Fusarium flagelliforme]RFN49814.1 transcriptional activator spt8 [Fusarium flagelliforme]
MNALDDDRLSNSSNDSDNDNDNDRIDQDNDVDEAMEDVDDNGDQDQDQDQDQDAEGDDDDNNDDDDDDENGDANDDADADGDGDGDAEGDESQPPAADSNDQTSTHIKTESNDDAQDRKSTTPSPGSRLKWPQPRPEAINARLYDIVPTMAAPQSTSVNAMAITPDLRYWITGGSDGYIRKYDGPNTINGKLALTVAQRHPFVDSVTKAGILMSYWENEEPAPPGRGDQEHILSPVYSLAVHSEALWLLSGLESGGINLQSVRHDEGKRIHCLQQHTNAVSVLTLAQDEKSVLSGGWDKNIFDWDLNTGQTIRSFDGNAGQISALELRPASGAPIPEGDDEPLPSTTIATNNGAPIANGSFTDGLTQDGVDDMNADFNPDTATGDGQASPAHDSLFGGSDAGSLFGETKEDQPFGHDDDEFGAGSMDMMPGHGHDSAMDHSADMAALDAGKDTETQPAPAVEPPPPETSQDAGDAMEVDLVPAPTQTAGSSQPIQSTQTTQDSQPPASQEPPASPSLMLTSSHAPTQHDPSQTSPTTFLSAAMDGSLRIWDRRQPDPVARIGTRNGVPPWCMGACWSPSGNAIYAGRRNGTVEEFDIHKAKRNWEPQRTLKFPAGSGAVSAVRPMVNGRHLVCASHDILRLYDLRDTRAFKHSTVPFLIIPGPPRAGVISSLYIDPTSRFMLSAAGTRGWEGTSTEVLIGYEIKVTDG